MGLGHRQRNPDGSPRFPFNPGPPRGKYPGWRHRAKPRMGRVRGAGQPIPPALTVSRRFIERIYRALRPKIIT